MDKTDSEVVEFVPRSEKVKVSEVVAHQTIKEECTDNVNYSKRNKNSANNNSIHNNANNDSGNNKNANDRNGNSNNADIKNTGKCSNNVNNSCRNSRNANNKIGNSQELTEPSDSNTDLGIKGCGYESLIAQ